MSDNPTLFVALCFFGFWFLVFGIYVAFRIYFQLRLMRQMKALAKSLGLQFITPARWKMFMFALIHMQKARCEEKGSKYSLINLLDLGLSPEAIPTMLLGLE